MTLQADQNWAWLPPQSSPFDNRTECSGLSQKKNLGMGDRRETDLRKGSAVFSSVFHILLPVS
jgi:hypothetical protein